jgi:hypothetical protein
MVVKSILRCPLLRHHFLAVAAFIDQPGRRGRLVEVLPSSKPAAIAPTPAATPWSNAYQPSAGRSSWPLKTSGTKRVTQRPECPSSWSRTPTGISFDSLHG